MKGCKTNPGNYRQISLTSVVGKVMESLERNHLVNHMTENNLFCDVQHRFVPGRSCMTQLLVVIELWTETLANGSPVDAIYVYFQKAFDIVPQVRLLEKLKAYGIDGTTRHLIRVFLTGHKQRVVVNSSQLAWLEVGSGVPQGSVLGPILFVMYINDLPDMISSTAHILADDTKVYRHVLGKYGSDQLQADLTRLVQWSETWQMSFNIEKCKVVHIGHKKRQTTYNMGQTELQASSVEKDLGVCLLMTDSNSRSMCLMHSTRPARFWV